MGFAHHDDYVIYRMMDEMTPYEKHNARRANAQVSDVFTELHARERRAQQTRLAKLFAAAFIVGLGIAALMWLDPMAALTACVAGVR